MFIQNRKVRIFSLHVKSIILLKYTKKLEYTLNVTFFKDNCIGLFIDELNVLVISRSLVCLNTEAKYSHRNTRVEIFSWIKMTDPLLF